MIPFRLRVVPAGMLIALLALLQSAWGCEPCSGTLNLVETVDKADLIIVGQKIADGTKTESNSPDYTGADWIEVQVIEVLKGDPPGQQQLKVKSWEDVCPYGIVVDDRVYVMFLEKKDDAAGEYQYDAVNSGCALKTLLLEDDKVNVAGQALALGDFIEMLRSSRR